MMTGVSWTTLYAKRVVEHPFVRIECFQNHPQIVVRAALQIYILLSLYQMIKNRIKACYIMTLDLFVKLKYESSTIILFVEI